jgi:hypothetical protein
MYVREHAFVLHVSVFTFLHLYVVVYNIEFLFLILSSVLHSFLFLYFTLIVVRRGISFFILTSYYIVFSFLCNSVDILCLVCTFLHVRILYV